MVNVRRRLRTNYLIGNVNLLRISEINLRRSKHLVKTKLTYIFGLKQSIEKFLKILSLQLNNMPLEAKFVGGGKSYCKRYRQNLVLRSG